MGLKKKLVWVDVKRKRSKGIKLRVAPRIPADTNYEILLSVPVYGESIGLGIEVNCSARGVVLLVVGVGPTSKGQVTACKGMIRSHDEVKVSTFFHCLRDEFCWSSKRECKGREPEGEARECNHYGGDKL
jgi:hypothetical protein